MLDQASQAFQELRGLIQARVYPKEINHFRRNPVQHGLQLGGARRCSPDDQSFGGRQFVPSQASGLRLGPRLAPYLHIPLRSQALQHSPWIEHLPVIHNFDGWSLGLKRNSNLFDQAGVHPLHLHVPLAAIVAGPRDVGQIEPHLRQRLANTPPPDHLLCHALIVFHN